jgi:hypothetical protein
MNRYGQKAWDHWRRWRPTMLAGIEDPETFFSTLGQQVEQQIDQLADQIAGPDRPGETPMQKIGRLREARMSAESDILRQEVLLPQENDEDSDPAASRLGEWITDQPDPDDPISQQQAQTRPDPND